MSEHNGLSAFEFFPATRETALQRLADFTPRMGKTYAEERNTDYGPHDRSNVSCLSPFHAHRLLLERETVQAALDLLSPNAAEKFLQEVYWRTYFKGWMEQHPAVWQRTRHAVEEQFRGLSSERRRAYEDACAGRTGLACMDAWTQELQDVGYLHNHTRMWFASIWIFTLKLPWVLGADLFYRHLLDGDAASNTLSWRWVAGLHTKGKNYLASASNIERFTTGRFRPEGQLVTDADPLNDDWNDETAPLPVSDPVDQSLRSLLLLHEDDLGFDTIDTGGAPLAGVAGITVTDGRSPFGVSERAKQFTIEAVEDALNRADDTMGVAAVKLASPEAAAEHARDIGADQIILPYVPVGPVRDRIENAAAQWREAGLRVALVVRGEDSRAWPHCSKGFFALKKAIPELIVLA